MVNGVPQQGDIIKLDLDPRKGHEQQGFRPVIVLSNNIVSQYTNVVIAALALLVKNMQGEMHDIVQNEKELAHA